MHRQPVLAAEHVVDGLRLPTARCALLCMGACKGEQEFVVLHVTVSVVVHAHAWRSPAPSSALRTRSCMEPGARPTEGLSECGDAASAEQLTISQK